MKAESQAKRNDRILMNIYSTSIGISLISLTVAVVMEIFMLTYTFVNQEFFGPYLPRYRTFYITLLTVAILAIFLNLYVKKDIQNRFKILKIASPVYAVFLFIWALTVTYSDYSVTGVVDHTVFMTFSLIVPLSVFIFPYLYAVIVTAANAVMIILTVLSGGAGQIINCVIFFIFQVVLGFSFLHLKVKLAERIVNEQDNAGLDAMTGFLNRRSYEEDLKKIRSNSQIPKELTYIVIDINSLKETNDKHGHDAGDNLIISTANCIEKCFSDKGKMYRIGGDEYVVILHSNKEETDKLLSDFEESMKNWSDKNGMPMSASYGCACAADFPGESINAIAKAADEKMYAAKEQYYITSGRDRRRYSSNPRY